MPQLENDLEYLQYFNNAKTQTPYSNSNIDVSKLLGIANLAIGIGDTLATETFNAESPVSNDAYFDRAVRGTAHDRTLIGSITDTFKGIFGGETSRERYLREGKQHAMDNVYDYSNVNNINNLTNVGLKLQDNISIPDDPTYKGNAIELNKTIDEANKQTVGNFYNQADKINRQQLRQNMMNYFAEGGSLEELNGVTKFNTGSSHENNPYGGIQQGIASDNLPNMVEEGELKYNDYIYSNRLKPSKSLLKQYNLPEKYVGKTFAEIGDKLQKESEERPNDPISKTTLDEWMLRLQNAQEDYKAKAEERRLARVVNNMSDEEKATLLSSLDQPMAQQEDIDLGQPIFAKGGKIHIKPSKRGTFTAAAKKRGMGVQEFASKVLANKENYSPAMVKKANFARNFGGHKHAIGDFLDIPPYLDVDGETTPVWEPNLFYNQVESIPLIPYARRVIGYKGKLGDPIEHYVKNLPYLNITPEEEKEIIAPLSKDKFKKDEITPPPADTKGSNFNAENLRYAPAVGSGIAALVAALQPVDYTLSNEYRKLASQLNPVAAPHIGGYRRYTPYDVNLGDAENLALQAAALRANRGQNRATQGALNTAIIAKTQEANAKRNLAAQQANEANRLAVDTYNLGIDQFNAQRDTQYDQLNQQILNNRLNMLAQAAQAADASKTAWANMLNTTSTNFFNQLGNVGRDEWNRNQAMMGLAMLDHAELVEMFGSEAQAKQIEDYFKKKGLRKN